MPDEIRYPQNIREEEPIKELLAQIYTELGALSFEIHKEKQVDVYLPRIDLLSILSIDQIECFTGTLFQYLRPVVCFEVHTRSLEEITFAQWQIELLGLYLSIAKDLNFHYRDFVGFSLLEHVPEKVLQEVPYEAIIPIDTMSRQPCLIKIAGVIPWFFILKPRLRYDMFCFPANLIIPERHPQLWEELKSGKYHDYPTLEKIAMDVLNRYHSQKGAPGMLDIASILEKSQDPSFVHFRKCRDELINKGKIEGKIEGEKKTLLKILTKRFGEVPQSIQEKILSIKDTEKLNTLVDEALSVESLSQIKIE